MDYDEFDIDRELELEAQLHEEEASGILNSQEDLPYDFDDHDHHNDHEKDIPKSPPKSKLFSSFGSSSLPSMPLSPVPAVPLNKTPHEMARALQSIRNQLNSSSVTKLRSTVSSEINFATFDEANFSKISRSERTKYMYKTPPRDGEFVQCILPNGDLHYIRCKNDNDESSSASRQYSFPASGNLLSKSMVELLRESEIIQVAADAAKSKRHSRSSEAATGELTDENKDFGSSSIDKKKLTVSFDGATGGPDHSFDQIWVDKFAPKSFSQLLSNDGTNKEVLKVIKQWDRYVFKKPNPQFDSVNKSAGPAKFQKPSAGGKPAGGGKQPEAPVQTANEDLMDKGDMDEDDDDDNDGFDGEDDRGRHNKAGIKTNKGSGRVAEVKDHRPECKVILLSGPPGSGKTTLAHIIARHCGYHPMEVNASDERTADALRDVMSRSMHSNTLLAGGKPNCVILDEIDGIDGPGAMEALVSIITAPLRGKDSKLKGKSSFPLTRPLICICNDHYAPSLRALRPLAKVFILEPPTEAKLVQRLKSICSREGLLLSTSAVNELCHATGNDIRSSINTLQFAALRALKGPLQGEQTHSYGPRDISSVVLSMVRSGLKDEQKSIFDIWQEIFNTKQMGKVLAKKKGLDQSVKDLLSPSKKPVNPVNSVSGCAVQEILQSVADHGDHQLIVTGLYENILKIRFHDPGMGKSSIVSDWLSQSDYFDECTRIIPGGFQLVPYIASAAAAAHLYCSQENRVRIEWPNKDKANAYIRKQRDNILDGFIAGASIKNITFSGKKVVALDVLSPLLDIICPKIRPLPISSMSAPEKEALCGIIKIMAATGLSYQFSSTATVTREELNATAHTRFVSLQLEPSIQQLVAGFKTFAGNMLTKNNRSSMGSSSSSSVGIDWEALMNRRHWPAPELKGIFYTELKSHLLNLKSAQDEDSNSTTNGTSTSLQQVHTSPYKSRSIAELDAAEEQVQKRAKFGRMDMFLNQSKESKGAISSAQVSATKKRSVAEVSAAPSSAAGGATGKRTKVRFKFAQGFSDAVRRPVSISEFL